ncbi:hypothetical protein OIU76_013866 [Salix suchowensis]|nr:hypothetical protein OIU76_013866 [Salix suchowensis]
MSGRVCQPNIKHPLFSSTLYPSPPANRASNMLACLMLSGSEFKHRSIKISQTVSNKTSILKFHMNSLRQLSQLPPHLLEVVRVIMSRWSNAC